MKLRVVVLFLIAFFCLTNTLFALNWITLHERADRESIDSASLGIKGQPASIDNLYVLGLVFFNLHKDEEAKNIFLKILKLAPKTIEAEWGVAEALRRMHRIDEAEPILERVIRENPEFTPAYISLAYIKYLRMDFKESVRLSLMVIQRGRAASDLSNYTRAYAMYAGAKGMIAHYGGPLSKAVNGLAVKPNLDKAQRLQPQSPAVLFGLGSYYFLAPVVAGGDKVKAEAYLRQVIEVNPLFTDAYVRLAQLYKIRGDSERYNFYINQASRIDPKNTLLLDHKSGKCRFICSGGEEKVKP
ncbi:MAG: tetratricopeptide repeat protein [Candidatus Omnitrophica bacterium]|nr:tetratricopeptide repeat protein [Candidatus Omnitrophota bacterium]